nr:heterokaryon incompatibility protein 6, or allele [Quercus suber]
MHSKAATVEHCASCAMAHLPEDWGLCSAHACTRVSGTEKVGLYKCYLTTIYGQRLRSSFPGPSQCSAPKERYTRLAVGEIRLLDLFPGVDNEPLRAKSRVVFLTSAPSYRASSYSWGSRDCTKSLILDQQPIGITESLFAALRGLRERTHTETLWADAICINQDDEIEKRYQLDLMASIYRSAELVARLASDRKLPPVSERLHEGLRAVKDVLDVAWFRRLWTLQENAVAKFSVLLFGQHGVTWDLLAVAINVCDGFAHCGSPFATKERERVSAGGHDLYLESRIKIYKGSLDSIRALAFVEHEAAFQLHINLPLSEIWPRVACFLLARQRSRGRMGTYLRRLFLLTLAGLQHGRKDPLLPSWVPDMAILDRQSFQIFYHSLVNCQSNHAGGPSGVFVVDITSVLGILLVQSIYLCKIVETSPGTQYAPHLNNWDDELRRSDCDDRIFLGPDHSLKPKYSGHDYDLHDPPLPGTATWKCHYWSEIQDRLLPWYITCYNFAYAKYQRSMKAESKVNDFSALLKQGSILNTPNSARDLGAIPKRREMILTRASEWLRDLRHDRGPGARSQPTPEQFHEDMLRASSPHFSDGRVGWVPEHAQKGDLVYLLNGAPEPCILRPALVELIRDPEVRLYTLVDDAYILGIMKSEAWPSDIKLDEDDTIGLI